MSFLAILLYIIQYVPELIADIQAIINFFHNLPLGSRFQCKKEIGQCVIDKDNAALSVAVKNWKMQCQPDVVSPAPSDLAKE
jgi:hypothetical protein